MEDPVPGLKLFFDAGDALMLARHALGSTRRLASLGKLIDPWYRKDGRVPRDIRAACQEDVDPARIPAEVWIVKGRGIYLASNGLPPPAEPGNPDVTFVSYARGMNPTENPHWEAHTGFLRGHPLVDPIPAEWFTMNLTPNDGEFEIEVMTTGLALTPPRRTPPAGPSP